MQKKKKTKKKKCPCSSDLALSTRWCTEKWERLLPSMGCTGVMTLPGDVTKAAAHFLSALVVQSLLCPHRGNFYPLLQSSALILSHFAPGLAVTAGCPGICCPCCWWQGLECACPPGTVAKTRGCFTPCAHVLVVVKWRTIHCLFLDLHAAPCTYITAAGCLQLFPWCAFILAVTFYSLSLKHEIHTSKGEPTPLCGVVSINGI